MMYIPSPRTGNSTALSACVQVQRIHDRIQTIMNEQFEKAHEYKPNAKDWLASHWEGFMSPAQMSKIRNTGAPEAQCSSV